MSETVLDPRPRLCDLPLSERPRERLAQRGTTALTDAELLAILLRTGSRGENVLDLAGRILRRFKTLPDLGMVSVADLCEERGIGEAKAAQVLAALALGQRIVSSRPSEKPTIRSAEDIFALVGAEMAFLENEHLRVVLLNTRHQVKGVKEIYRGSVHSAVVRVAEVFQDAVREKCSGLIVVHNHPTGDPAPSAEDVSLTKQLVEAGRLLNIEVVDHVVIGRTKPVSLRDLGIGFGR